jgi:hypothetical protein
MTGNFVEHCIHNTLRTIIHIDNIIFGLRMRLPRRGSSGGLSGRRLVDEPVSFTAGLSAVGRLMGC